MKKIPTALCLNRSLILLKPKQPFKDFCEFPASYDWKNDHFSVLVPDLQDEKECLAYLKAKQRFSGIFRDILWIEAGEKEALFPDTQSFEVFLEWFELEYHGMVYDCSDDYLPTGEAKFDLYYREGTPNWYIGSNGQLSEEDWLNLMKNQDFLDYQKGFSNQWAQEDDYKRQYRKKQS